MRSRLTPDLRKAMSREIEEKLFALREFRDARTVLFYASFRSEVETHEMVRRALAEGKRVVLPKVEGDHLILFQIADFDRDVKPGAWGIPEPTGEKQLLPEQMDLIVVPGAAFDPEGNRLGYGAGFYDKLLKQYQGHTAALAFELQILNNVPADPHDVPVHRVVTEKRVIETKA